MSKNKDLTGQKFNRLTVLERAGKDKHGHSQWLCKCDCGNPNLTKVTTGGLLSGNNQSCGCLHRETFTAKTHGGTGTRLYNTYMHMKRRCYSPNNKDYVHYGHRGIKMCSDWVNNFQSFRDWAIANGYRDDLTIDRINVDGDYEPANCRWVDMNIQCNNKRTNRKITYNGETHTLKEWAKILDVNYGTLLSRINKYKWSEEKALSTKIRKY